MYNIDGFETNPSSSIFNDNRPDLGRVRLPHSGDESASRFKGQHTRTTNGRLIEKGPFLECRPGNGVYAGAGRVYSRRAFTGRTRTTEYVFRTIVFLRYRLRNRVRLTNVYVIHIYIGLFVRYDDENTPYGRSYRSKLSR